MNSNELSLDVAKTHSLKTMRLVDTSKYCDDVDVENYLIEILPVNKKDWRLFHVHKNFNMVFNSSSLGYKKVGDVGSLVDIPDGIYEIKQSYKPNSKTVAHYYHLRTVALNLKYVEILCNHFSDQCTQDKREHELDSLRLIKVKQYIDAAEYAVSEKHNKQQGIDFYNRAVSLLDELEKNCGCH